MTRVVALVGKELPDLRQNPAVFVPAVLTGFFAVLLPFFVAVIVPHMTSERLSDSSDFQIAIDMYRNQPSSRVLDPEGAIQAWIFQQFLMLLVLTPVTGSMSVAAYSVVGEKQARTLEPLLATPITTLELLGAKVLASLLPAIALATTCFGLYIAGIVLFAHPGVVWTLMAPRPLSIVFLLGPLSSRRAAAGRVRLVAGQRRAQRAADRRADHPAHRRTARRPAHGQRPADRSQNPFIALILAGVNIALLRIGVRLFDRESILTRWK